MARTGTLSWTASVDTVDGYNIYQGTAPGNESTTPLNTAPIVGTSYLVTVQNPGAYSFVVTSVKAGVESVHSNEVLATVKPFPPTAVTMGQFS